MTDKYEKEFPLSGPLTFPGRIDKKIAEVFERTTGSGSGTGTGTGTSGSADASTAIDEYVSKMSGDQAGKFAQKLASYSNAVSTLVGASLQDSQITQFFTNLVNQLLSSNKFRDAVNALIASANQELTSKLQSQWNDTTDEFLKVVDNNINNVTKSDSFKNDVAALVKQYMAENTAKSGSGTDTNGTQQPTNSGNASN